MEDFEMIWLFVLIAVVITIPIGWIWTIRKAWRLFFKPVYFMVSACERMIGSQESFGPFHDYYDKDVISIVATLQMFFWPVVLSCLVVLNMIVFIIFVAFGLFHLIGNAVLQFSRKTILWPGPYGR